MSGTPASQIQDLARRLAKAKAASMVTTSNFAKYYHGNLIERTQALVFALTGNYGKKGSGFVGFPFLMHDGLEKFVLGAFGLGLRGLIGAYGFYRREAPADGRLHRRDDDLRAQPQELRVGHGVLGRALLVRARRAARGERAAAGVGPASEAAGARGARRIAVQGLAVRLAQARQPAARHVLAGEQSAAAHPRLSAAAEEPVAEAAHDRDHRLAHDLDRAAVGLRAAGRRLVRAHRTQVGDAAHAVHPRRRESHRVLRGQVRLGDLRAAGQGGRRTRRGARHHRVQRSRRPRALLRRALQPVLLQRRVRSHRRRQGGRRNPARTRPTCKA